MLKVLLIAPTSADLPAIASEIAAIVKMFDVRQVINVVRESDIQAAVHDAPFDLVWWATHGGPEGVLITGSTLSPESVGDYVRASGASLCVLNTCASEDIAIQIVAGGRAAMVYTITSNIGDRDATRFAILFCEALAEMGDTTDYQAAFTEAAGPAPEKYRFLEAGQALRALTVTAAERLSVRVEELQERYYELRATVTLLAAQVEQVSKQSIQNQQAALQAQASAGQMANLDRRLVDNRLSDMHSPITTGRQGLTPVFWALLSLIGLVLVSLAIWVGRMM